MSEWFAIIILCICGAAISTQATVNVALGRSLGLCFYAFVFTVVQLIATIPPLALFGRPIPWHVLGAVPWWQYIGGALGMPILIGMSSAMGRTGTFAGLTALLFGQMIMGLLIDRFGLFAAPMHVITWQKVVGLGFVALGVWFSRQ